MNIGVKYCGGCRSAYDRKELVERLIAKHDNIRFESARENMEYDVLLVLNGCRTACSNHSKYICIKKIFINCSKDYMKISIELTKE